MIKNARQAIAQIAFGVATTTLALAGCRVSEDDIQRWEQTELGPDKLVAVITHDKYDWPLRVDAAVALVRMKPRAGRREGISRRLPESVAALSPEDRKKLMNGLVPVLASEMEKPPTVQQGIAPAEKKEVDTSIPFKDAAVMLLTYDKAVLVSEEEHRKALQNSLVKWAAADFDKRSAITSQLFGMEQVFRLFGSEGARSLPALIGPDTSYDRAANLIAELGDAQTKDAASQKLVSLAQYTENKAWIEKKKPQVQEANKAAGYNVSDDKLTRQVVDFQEEQLVKVYGAMKKVGGRPVVEYLLGVAADKNKPEKRRQTALAALEGRLDRNNASDVQRVIAIAAAEDTPDTVRELALQRVSEMPREPAAPRLYELFANKRWKIRWVAASTLLKMSSAKDVQEFQGHLPSGAAFGFAMSEPLTYGDLMGKMKPAPSKEQMAAELKSSHLAAKLTALGYFYAYGRAPDISLLDPLADDRTALPKVEDPEGKWQCSAPKADGKAGESEVKDLTSVGEFVKLCVLPTVRERK